MNLAQFSIGLDCAGWYVTVLVPGRPRYKTQQRWPSKLEAELELGRLLSQLQGRQLNRFHAAHIHPHFN
jgi:hypothetical protein